MQSMTPRSDPAPSRWRYRYQRMMLTPYFRFLLRVFLPLVIALGAGSIYFAKDARRDAVLLWVSDVRTSIETRPEFMVNVMAIDGASAGIAEDIREVVPIDFPLSSFDLDLNDIQQQIAALPAVKSATVRIRPGGIMQVEVAERDPVILWRNRDGLHLVDEAGFVIAALPTRSARADLPIMAGDGAESRVPEALALIAAAGPLTPRIVGLVRIGSRRWDVVLDRDQRILLPETGAVQAFERVIALSEAQDMLARDVLHVDMRLAHRPTLRIAQRSVQDWRRIQKISLGKTGE